MPDTFQEAIEALARKRSLPVPATAGSEALAALPAAISDQALFSAKVGNTKLLQGIFERLARILQPESAAPGEFMDTPRAREELRQILASSGYAPEPGQAGSIQDLTSTNRLNLIIDHNVATARARGQWAQTQDPTILDAWPCQELIRAEPRRLERNWPRRWVLSGGRLVGGGRMIARKDDPIWKAISRFGTPWPPFDFNSGMRLRDIPRAEAESLGVIQPTDTVPPQADPALTPSASAASIDPGLLKSVLASLPGATVRNGLLTLGAA